MKEQLHQTIFSLLEKRGADAVEFAVEPAENPEHGDYATNVAMVAAKELKTNPKQLADEFVAELSKKLPAGVREVRAAGPGFINFFLSREYFSGVVARVIEEGERFGKNESLKGQKVMVEYTDPNPFKELHIGHLMSNAIGEGIARLFEAQGAEVKRACYQGDVGLHVAKAVWGMESVPRREGSPLDSISLEAKAHYLGHAYSLGAAAYEEGSKQEIDEINKKVYDRSDPEINKLYDWGRKVSLDYFEQTYNKLGTKFDYFFFESEAGPAGRQVVEEGLARNIFEKSEGAVVFHAEKHDPPLHTRVFVNSQGLPTYEAKELGLAEMKAKRYPYDRSVIITGNEVNDYFRVLLQAMKLVYPDLAAKTEHLSHGMLRLPSGKMSSRTGDVITAESLLARVAALVEEKIAARGYDEKLKSEIVEAVSVGAIKYSILRQAVGGDIVFDFEKSISFEGDSGPYLQYAATRAQSVLEKAKEMGLKPDTKRPTEQLAAFERLLAYFPEVVERAGKEYAPHFLVTYLVELSGAFNAFYAKKQIADEKDSHSPYRLALTKAFRTVMANGFRILGIKIPSRM